MPGEPRHGGVSAIMALWMHNRKFALIIWIGLFIGFGPVYWLLIGSTFNSTVFTDNPFAYSMFQGIFVATFTLGVTYLVFLAISIWRRNHTA